ncbi:MAG: hypothetical protein QM539_05775 [Alphaproteobacteria bacterium]|nr:hypothetical protein [Alphaproteobacteria bacterium]
MKLIYTAVLKIMRWLFDNKTVYFFLLPAFILNSCVKVIDPIYTSVSITKITLNDFPELYQGRYNWDNVNEGYLPDVYFDLRSAVNDEILYSCRTACVVPELSYLELPIFWGEGYYGPPIFTYYDINIPIYIDLFDQDILPSGIDDYLGTTEVDFSDYTYGAYKYPKYITSTYGNLSFTLELRWFN